MSTIEWLLILVFAIVYSGGLSYFLGLSNGYSRAEKDLKS